MHERRERNYAEVSQDEDKLYLEARINREDLPKAAIAGIAGTFVGGFVGGIMSEISTHIGEDITSYFVNGVGRAGGVAGFAIGAYLYLRHQNEETAVSQQAQNSNSTSTTTPSR